MGILFWYLYNYGDGSDCEIEPQIECEPRILISFGVERVERQTRIF